jgi:putative membrane protein insertion efficiency factor
MKVSVPARTFLGTLNLYQRLTVHRPSPCRYVPSCSTYAHDAIETHGAARGTWLALRRLSRCHPWGGHGFDPVPVPRAVAIPDERQPC